MLIYPDDTPIPPIDMVEELRKTRRPLNWVRSIITLIEKHITRQTHSAYQKNNDMMDENARNISENAKETERVSSEIERAKREGNVAEEERLKVQLTRLTDERTSLNALRREMEIRIGYETNDNAEGVPESPKYSSIWDNSSVSGQAQDSSEHSGGNDDDRLRGAVASFNEKMIEKYGKDDANIPTTATDGGESMTPRSPAYSSIFEGGGGRQHGGESGRIYSSRSSSISSSSSSNRFIPQIPTGVLESYLSSRYSNGGGGFGGSSTTAMKPIQQVGGRSMFETGGSNLGSMMGATMNVPVVATMPMTGMMPVQAQAQPALQQSTQVGGVGGSSTPAQQTGGTITPNADGVKTFSIKI